MLYQSAFGANAINIDEINSRQDEILAQLDDLDHKINEIIEIWTKTSQSEEPLENAA